MEERSESKLSFQKVTDVNNDIEIPKSPGECKPNISEILFNSSCIASINDESNRENVIDTCSPLTEDPFLLNEVAADLQVDYFQSKLCDIIFSKTHEERPDSKLSFQSVNDILNDILEISKLARERKPNISEIWNISSCIGSINEESNLGNVNNASSPLTEDLVLQNEVPADLQGDCFKSKSCDITISKSPECSEIQNEKTEANSPLIDVTKNKNPLLSDPERQLKKEANELTSIGAADLNIPMVYNASINPENLPRICSPLTEDPLSYNKLPSALKPKHSESKDFKVANSNTDEYSEIQKYESDKNTNIHVINSSDQTEFKIVKEKGSTSKLSFKNKLLEVMKRAQETKIITKEMENHLSDSLKRLNEEKNFLYNENCFPHLNTEPDDKEIERTILPNLSKGPIKAENRKLNRERRILYLNEINQNRAVRRDENCMFEPMHSKPILVICILQFITIVTVKMTSNSAGMCNCHGINNGRPDIHVDQLISILLVDAFEDRKWANEARMYSIASMYGIDGLKNRTSIRLQSSITISNAWITLALADVHKDRKLKESAESFLTTNSKETLYSEDWKSKMQSMMTAATQKYREDFESHYRIEESRYKEDILLLSVSG